METAAEESNQPVSGTEFENENDLDDVNQDDEFDFEINGGDEFNNLEEIDNSDVRDATLPEPFLLSVDEVKQPAANIEHDVEKDHVAGQDEEGLVVPDSDDSVEAQAFDPNVQDDHDHDHNAAATATGDATCGEAAENYGYESVDYEEASGNISAPEFVSTEQTFVHELSNVTPSVDSVRVDSDQDEAISVLRSASDQAQAERNAVENSGDFMVTTNDVEEAGERVYDELVRDESNIEKADVKLDDSHIEVPSVAADEQSDWNAEEDDSKESRSDAFPNVTVSYQGQDYFLFAESADEDPDTFFLDDVGLMNQPLSRFLSSVRDVISSEIETHQEIILQVDGLGVEFGQSTAQEFIDHTTFADIVELNKRLVQLDGGSQSPELYTYLRVRSNPLHRFDELTRGANEGRGLSHFEKYYEAASADASTTNEAELLEMAQDMDYDDISLGDAHEEAEDQHEDTAASEDAKSHSPLVQQTDDLSALAENQEQQLAASEAAFLDVIGNGEREEDEEEEAKEYDDYELPLDEVDPLSVDMDQTSAFESADMPEANVEGNMEDVSLAAIELGEEAADDEQQNESELSNDAALEEVNQQAESRADLKQAALEGTVLDTTEDENYLDLGDEVDLLDTTIHTKITTDVAATHTGIPQQVSGTSSATATLDGDHSANGDDITAGHVSTSMTPTPAKTDLDTSADDVDEIDWNLDEDDDFGTAHDSLPDLSPSAPSAKRVREEDQVASGLADDTAAKRPRVETVTL
ncbi:hypothetical protein BD289DRAFT_99376 [Coniella lustricola]|uniref:Uncharacterized protein n=1 Tax=Coniella lustricola TaxID=2025994 RepID=A0A2T3AN28_9PEZI|nr:hypothetical protein BD289DRAFT_99376 [Coniella lustricola]